MGLSLAVTMVFVVSGFGADFPTTGPRAPQTSEAKDPGRIASCEWRVFEPGSAGGPPQLTAVRIADTQGHDGVCVMLRDGNNSHFTDRILHDAKLREAASTISTLLIGQDASTPQAIKAIWDQMEAKKAGFDLETAIDLALWDLYGRAHGKPVADLIGRKREKVATHLATLWPPLGPFRECKNHQETVAAYVKLARQVKERGLLGFKIHPYINGTWNPVEWRPLKKGERGAFPDQNLEIVRAVYAELGNSMPLMFDPGWQYNLDEAIRVGKVLDEMKFTWYEDPLPEWADRDALMKDWIALRKAIKTPLMGPQEFLTYKARIHWLEAGAADWARIDICYGGYTPCLELIRYCEQHKIRIDLHANPMEAYMLACYPITDDATMPWIELYGVPPPYVPPTKEFPGSEPAPKNQPWFKRMPAYLVDDKGYAHFNLDISGLGPEADWAWIAAHGKDPFR
jgi:L-alanine-DL-glutamate epimerase-like enolase superfamily enzyme